MPLNVGQTIPLAFICLFHIFCTELQIIETFNFSILPRLHKRRGKGGGLAIAIIKKYNTFITCIKRGIETVRPRKY